MPAQISEYNFSIYQGADFTPRLILRTCGGELLYVGRYKLAMELKRSPTSSAADTLTTSNGRITTDTEDPYYVDLSFSVSDTRRLKTGRYMYELVAIVGSHRSKLLRGSVFVLPEVTTV